MFERYTKRARNCIFFARYQASQFGSPIIGAEYLLLGLVHEGKADVAAFLPEIRKWDSLRAEVEAHLPKGKKISTKVDLPLSIESKRVLAYGAEEATRLGDEKIRPEHLLIGLLREKGCFAAKLLKEHGADLKRIREALKGAQSADEATPVYGMVSGHVIPGPPRAPSAVKPDSMRLQEWLKDLLSRLRARR